MLAQSRARYFVLKDQIILLAENVGVGEREARIASEMVAQRHFR